MENASKALIIAGAILLSILIIGLGMFIFQQASSTLDDTASKMSQQERNTHNASFTQYKGIRRGTEANALLTNLIQTHATAVQKGNFDRIPKVQLKDEISKDKIDITLEAKKQAEDGKYNEMQSKIKSQGRYNIKVNISETSGIVDEVVIERIK